MNEPNPHHSHSLKRQKDKDHSIPKKKESQVDTLHLQFQLLKDQMKSLPQKDEGSKMKERIKYAED